MSEPDRTIIVHGWPYEEKSTRNCVHCKVCLVKGKRKAYCDHAHLSLRAYTDHNPNYDDIGRYALSLVTVNRCPTWASSVCIDCPLFEHDIAPPGESELKVRDGE